MDFSSYRLSYLKSIICTSIISTTVICTILSCPCFSDSTSTGSTSGSVFVSSSSPSPYSQNRQHYSSSRHHYYLKQQQKSQESPFWNSQTRSWTSASSRDRAAHFNGRGSRKSRRRGLYHTHHPSISIYGGSDAEDELRAADPDNYDAQRAVFLRHAQRPQRNRVSDLRSRTQRWVVESLFRSHGPLDQDDICDDNWDDEEEDEEEEYEDDDLGFREEQEQEESDFDAGEAEEAKDKESHTLDAILRPASTSGCPRIPQWTWPTRKYNHLQHQQGRYRLHRLYPKHDILIDSQPHQQQDQLSRQPTSHKQFSRRLRTRATRTWRLESIHPQRPDRQQQHHHPYNKLYRQNRHMHTAGGRHSRRSRNGRRPSSSGPFSSACTSSINRIFSLSSPSPTFLSTFTDCRRILVDYLSDSPRLAKSFKGAMDTLLFFLSDLPNSFSSLLHQDFASALFSTAPPTTSARFSHQRQYHTSFSSWFSNYNHHGSNNVHGPQRIPPHPLLEMAACNILIRLGLLVVLCLGAFYYCVTTMEQQQRQIAGMDGGAGSNWLADPVPATSTTATNSNSTAATGVALATTTTESHPRRSLSDLYPSVTSAFTTTGSNISLGSAGRATAGRASTLLTPGMTAAEVMASLGRSVNHLEQLHRQQLQQQRMGGQLLNLSLVNGVHTGPESADPTTTTPSTPASITAGLISVLIRSTATAMALTCGADNHLHSHVPPYSASTTPALPCSNVFSGSEKVADGKPGFEPEWKVNLKNGDIDHKAQKKKDPQQDLPQPAYNNNDFDEAIYQSEQEFGQFSTAGPFDTEDDTLREYRNMMYYSSNYLLPYSATFGSGGGESSRSSSRRSSIFTPSPSPPAPALDQVAAATTAVISHISETQGLVKVEEEEEAKSPFWTHFYTLDALKSPISHRLSTTATEGPPSVLSHQRQQHGLCFRPSPRRKWTSNKTRPRTGTTTRVLPNRSPLISTSSSTSPSAPIPSPSSSRSVSVSATTSSTASSRRHRARTARQQSLVQ